MIVVNVCKANMTLTYAEAVAKAYIRTREARWLLVQLPSGK
jgi:hypothetical protein